jgi:hypothetical protein
MRRLVIIAHGSLFHQFIDISQIHIGTRQRTMNGLSSYLEYGRGGVAFASTLPNGWNPDWHSCGRSAIWDMTYVKDGYGGTTRARIAEGMEGNMVRDELGGKGEEGGDVQMVHGGVGCLIYLYFLSTFSRRNRPKSVRRRPMAYIGCFMPSRRFKTKALGRSRRGET